MKETHTMLAVARFCNPSELVSETDKFTASIDLTYIVNLYVFPCSIFCNIEQKCMQQIDDEIQMVSHYKIMSSYHAPITRVIYTSTTSWTSYRSTDITQDFHSKSDLILTETRSTIGSDNYVCFIPYYRPRINV